MQDCCLENNPSILNHIQTLYLRKCKQTPITMPIGVEGQTNVLYVFHTNVQKIEQSTSILSEHNAFASLPTTVSDKMCLIYTPTLNTNWLKQQHSLNLCTFFFNSYLSRRLQRFPFYIHNVIPTLNPSMHFNKQSYHPYLRRIRIQLENVSQHLEWNYM